MFTVLGGKGSFLLHTVFRLRIEKRAGAIYINTFSYDSISVCKCITLLPFQYVGILLNKLAFLLFYSYREFIYNGVHICVPKSLHLYISLRYLSGKRAQTYQLFGTQIEWRSSHFVFLLFIFHICSFHNKLIIK